MFVEVGFSDNPDSTLAGELAAQEALRKAKRPAPCDMVLLFATARHDAATLREAVTRILGHRVPVIGGSAVGIITQEHFGYAGDQVGLAAFWLDTGRYDLFVEGGLHQHDEASVGEKLGRQLAAAGIVPSSSIALFYDSIDRSKHSLRMNMALPLMDGIEKGLGFLPNMVGAGLQGDFIASPTHQWVGSEESMHCALALHFSEGIRIDHVIMHGCRPGTSYYTVTKSSGQTIQEINGQPALTFIDSVLNHSVPPENLPFFLLLGINSGDKWGPFDENNYANRLCLAIDKKQQSISMFEPDMVPGTEFQIMYRELDLAYMVPRIESLFAQMQGRKPLLALYIDCAGRAAGYAGMDMEDAVVVQNTVAGRVPLLGIYSGVEIASLGGRPRGLDWTGVFCLLSMPL